MALHVRHNLLPPPTRRIFFSVSAVACLCAAAIMASQSPIHRESGGTPSSPLQIVTQTQQRETTETIRVEQPLIPDEKAPQSFYLIDTTPSFPSVDNAPQPDIAALADESAPLITADLTETYEETAPLSPKNSPHKSAQSEETAYTPPQYAATPQPPYPKDLQRRRISGTVRVRIHINALGAPTSVEILSSTHPSFSQAAKQAILSSWRFTPAASAGTPVAANITTNINFTLH